MKKLLVCIALMLFLVPSFALAQEAAPAETCNLYTCKCVWPYFDAITGSAIVSQLVHEDVSQAGFDTDAECKEACIVESGVSPQQESWVTGTAECVYAPAVGTAIRDPIFPQLNVIIPGLGYVIKNGEPFWTEAGTPDVVNGVQQTNILGLYVKALYNYLLGAATIVAVTMLMIAGIQYATARGDSKQVENAKRRIGNAVAGVILLLLAYNIAFLINPATTTFDSLGIQNVKGVEIDDETPANFEEDFVATTEEGPISVPLLDQKDFATSPYGPERCLTSTSGNIKSSGCGVVSFTMAANALGCTSSGSDAIDPPFVANVFYNNGEDPSYRPLDSQGCGVNGTYNSAMYENPLIAACNLRARQIPINDQAQLTDLVNKGKLIITSYKTSSGGGHYVLISGVTKDGKLIVSNPWGGTREARSFDWWFSTIKSAAYIDTNANFIP